ncbi:MAG: hypothetical protein E7441_06950 [Ruminococcaceae bacterium]|nr:hypothetical protein [Oscillospiraceae bacterium]
MKLNKMIAVGLIALCFTSCAYTLEQTSPKAESINSVELSTQELLSKYSTDNIPVALSQILERLNINYENMESDWSCTKFDSNNKLQTYREENPNDLPPNPDSALQNNFYDEDGKLTIRQNIRNNFLESIDVYERIDDETYTVYSFYNSEMYTEPIIERVSWRENGRTVASAEYNTSNVNQRTLLQIYDDYNREYRRFFYNENGTVYQYYEYEYSLEHPKKESKIMTYDAVDVLQSYREFLYSADGKVVNSYRYDDKGLLTTEYIYDSEGKETDHYIKHEYEGKRKIKSLLYKYSITSTQLLSYVVYIYDSNGVLKEEQTYDAQGNRTK